MADFGGVQTGLIGRGGLAPKRCDVVSLRRNGEVFLGFFVDLRLNLAFTHQRGEGSEGNGGAVDFKEATKGLSSV